MWARRKKARGRLPNIQFPPTEWHQVRFVDATQIWGIFFLPGNPQKGDCLLMDLFVLERLGEESSWIKTMEKSLGQFLWCSLWIEVPGSSAWVWLVWGWSKVLNLDSNALQKSTRHYCAPNLMWGGQLQTVITDSWAWNIAQGFCHTVDFSKQHLGFS